LPGGIEAGFADRGVHHLDVGNLVDPAANLPFQVRPARDVGGELVAQRGGRAQHVPGGSEVNAVGAVLQYRHAIGDHVVEQTRKVRVELGGAARHQQVDVTTLRHGGPVGRAVGKLVALIHRHPVVEIRKHPRCA
jgi:hypothetical protein